MVGHGSKLSCKMEQAIAALMSHRSIEEAAKAIPVSPKTLQRWLKVPEFKHAYGEARRAVVHQAVARMQQSTGAACIVLLKLMTDPKVQPAISIRAAAYILDYSFKGLEMDTMEEMEARLSELERHVKDAKTGGGK
jgi:hypothetical protein